ncbi:SirB2 family protein [Neisseria animalis]|uniref:SirB family protein n=1 Tax=Neisseria animalis TaxID=492 RepID=A0A5P3MSC3_NEIAN|nr:SirB2 family protein [Neisseria animalis]QEY24503.1 SirB family protein [Neisseria animalis]ROW33078.1 SirB family protein [Neisseria animalis]VEE07210.1 Regulator [Neisseria animalis]
MQYLIVKHSHILFVAITILLFNIRFFLLRAHPEKPLAGVWRALPHLNDTMLLFTALWLMKLTHLTPFNSPWLAVKVILLLVYIALGMVMMRARPRSGKFYSAYGLAMIAVAVIIYMARFKPYF